MASLCHITILSKIWTKTVTWKLVPELLCLQKIKHNLYRKIKFLKQAFYIRYVLAKLLKFVQISTLTSRFLFTKDSWKIKKGLELVSRSNFQPNFITRLCLLFKLFSKMYFRHLMASWHFNTWKVKIWLSQEWKELTKWNKNYFSLFH